MTECKRQYCGGMILISQGLFTSAFIEKKTKQKTQNNILINSFINLLVKAIGPFRYRKKKVHRFTNNLQYTFGNNSKQILT